MWPNTRLTELLGIAVPIVQAPMAGSGTPELAVAVSNAGGLGSVGCGFMPAAEIPSLVAALRSRTNGAFNLNFFAHRAPADDAETWLRATRRLMPYYRELGLGPPTGHGAPDPEPGFGEAALDALLAAPPPVVSFHFGVPEGDALDRLKGAGCVLLSSATSVAEACALEAAGVDAVIAQGWEAGGHRGAFAIEDAATGVGLMALVPQVADAVSIPVIAAGGIADGRGIAAALMLGADGAQLGSAFLSCPEVGIADAHRRALETATDADTVLTLAYSGRPCRLRRSRYVDEMARDPVDLPEFPLTYALTAPLRAAEDTARSTDFQFLLYGQGAALNRSMPAAALVATLAAETAERLGG
jgi:nitronate monooxygenase